MDLTASSGRLRRCPPRRSLAAGGGTWTDTMHIVLAMVTVPLMLVAIGVGAAALGKRFRYYSMREPARSSSSSERFGRCWTGRGWAADPRPICRRRGSGSSSGS